MDDFRSSPLEGHALEPYIPTLWTPEHVIVRMSEASRIIEVTEGFSGPSKKCGYWPIVLRIIQGDKKKRGWVHRGQHGDGDFSQWTTEDLDEEPSVEDQLDEFNKRAERIVSQKEMADAEEALCWPMQYLSGEPLRADALVTLCHCRGTGRTISKYLHDRAKRADAMIERLRLLAPREITKPRRRVVMPNKVMTSHHLWNYANKAAKIIANALIINGIQLR